jgi:hypothetical protein
VGVEGGQNAVKADQAVFSHLCDCDTTVRIAMRRHAPKARNAKCKDNDCC